MSTQAASMLGAGLLAGLIIGALIVWTLIRPKVNRQVEAVEVEIANKRARSESEAAKLLEAARKEAREERVESEKAIERRYDDLAKVEERIDRRQAALDQQLSRIEARDGQLIKRQSRLDHRFNELSKMEEQRAAELQRVAGMTTDEARQQLLDAVEQESRQDMARIMREITDRAKHEADDKARELVAQAIQRVASEHVASVTVSLVPLPSEEMKGRIIGRNGRNIKAFEEAAGVDVVVDDTPEAVTISSFDSVRREVARQALSKLVIDGRIHPARIEKTIADARADVERTMREAGEQAALDANVHGLRPEVIKMLGRLKFRTSYGQNQLFHAVEASKIAAVLASELGANIEICKMGALLHDLGKAMDHDQEGTHAALGADFARRFKVPTAVVNAIASHHHEVDQDSVESIIVEASDAISGARPGARRESLENYIKRVRTLEDIAISFDGVESAYALQAGREVRILVKPGTIDDYGALRLSKDIAKTIEDSMQYPGQIQVTVIRETRAVGFAK